MPRKSFYIFKNERIDIGWFAGDASKKKMFRLDYGRDTRIIGITMYLRSKMVGMWCSGAFTEVIANGQSVCKVEWGVFDTEPKECTKDVTGVIGKGDNEIVVRCHKDPFVCFAPRTWYVTVILTVEYEGREPNITPPMPEWAYKLMQVAPWIALAVAIGAFAGYSARGEKK